MLHCRKNYSQCVLFDFTLIYQNISSKLQQQKFSSRCDFHFTVIIYFYTRECIYFHIYILSRVGKNKLILICKESKWINCMIFTDQSQLEDCWLCFYVSENSGVNIILFLPKQFEFYRYFLCKKNNFSKEIIFQLICFINLNWSESTLGNLACN